MELLRTCVCLLFVLVFGDAGRLDFLRLPNHDGVSRTCRLTAENLTTVVSDAQKTTVVFYLDTLELSTCPSSQKTQAEILVQALSGNGVKVCIAPSELRQEKGDVVIYSGGRKLPYYGKRCASAILSFLNKLGSGSQVRIITGKLDKVAFDAIQEPKLVGLFMNNTPDFKAYEEASSLMSPSAHFYAVFDRTVAKHLRLEVVGEVYLYKPMHKTPVVCPVNPATVAELQAFLQAQRGAALTKITENNINDPDLDDPTRVLVVAIGEQTSPLGAYLYRLLTKTIRNNTNNTEYNRLNVLWVEPDLFPSVYLASVSSAAGIPGRFPSLGSLSETSSVWFDMAQLNGTADKTADEQNVALIKAWLDAVLTSTVGSGAQSFLIQPSSRTVVEGSDFVLECRIQNPVGDCLWLHNGQNLGFNMARYGGLYTWVAARDQVPGECSLKVSGAKAGRQDGQWVCEMTGNDISPTITSQPAIVVVTPQGGPKMEL